MRPSAAQRKEPRAEHDFYPTPPDVTHALREWLLAHAGIAAEQEWLDPAAGNGDLIREMAPIGASWSAIEIDAQRETTLRDVAQTYICDALVYGWPVGTHIAANPPFNLLDDFWQRIALHRRQHGVWCAVLTPVAWWHAERRREYVRPDFMLALGWRPSFMQREGKDVRGMQDMVWCVLAPERHDVTTWTRLEKPKP